MKILAYIILVPLIAVNTSKCTSKKPKDDKTTATTTTTSTPKDTTASTVTSATTTSSGEGTAGINNPPADSIQNAIHGGQNSTDPPENYRFTVSFASRASGIDHTTQAAFLKWMGEFQPHVVFEETHWGREGEVDYCLKLSELSTKDQERFVKEARSLLANKDLIFVNENSPCAHKR